VGVEENKSREKKRKVTTKKLRKVIHVHLKPFETLYRQLATF
jgi:hypothetical protein